MSDSTIPILATAGVIYLILNLWLAWDELTDCLRRIWRGVHAALGPLIAFPLLLTLALPILLIALWRDRWLKNNRKRDIG